MSRATDGCVPVAPGPDFGTWETTNPNQRFLTPDP